VKPAKIYKESEAKIKDMTLNIDEDPYPVLFYYRLKDGRIKYKNV